MFQRQNFSSQASASTNIRVLRRPAAAQDNFHKPSKSSSKRQARDPDQYASYDALREDLHSRNNSSGFISSALNFLSQTAFGDQKRRENEDGGRLYRKVLDSAWATGLVSDLSTRPGHVKDNGAGHSAEADGLPGKLNSADCKELTDTPHRGLAILLGCDTKSVSTCARRWPPLLQMDLGDLHRCLVLLKEELPGVNVTEMVMQYPKAFLDNDPTDLQAAISANLRMLQKGLAGADINAMVEEDPLLLLQDSELLKEGIAQMRELWNVDAATLADSDPWKLAMAVRAMTKSSTALPFRF